MARKHQVLPLAVAIGLSASALAQAQQGSGGPAASIEEFVVTATRREESLAKVPVSISAYSQARMDSQGIKSIDDIARFTPGLTFAPSSDGLTSSIAIRGVSSGVGASTTGVYIDDTPVQVRSGTGVVTENMYPQVFDLERVEVLRGPQGTLFGTGSMGGTVRFITPEPSLDTYSGYARAEYGVLDGGEPGSEIGVSGGGPIVPGTSAFRVSLFYSDAGGYVDRKPFDGSGNTDKDINSEKTTALRAALKFAIGDDITVKPSVFYQRKRRNDGYFWESLSDEDNQDFSTGWDQKQPGTDEFTLPSLNINWALGGVDLVINSSYLDRELERDSDYSTFLWFALVGDPTPTDPVADYRAVSQAGVRQKSWTHEVRLQSTDESSALTWVVGALYQSSRLETDQYVTDPFLPQLSLDVYGAPIEDIFGVGLVDGIYSATIDQRAKDEQSALFGQIDYALTDALTLTLGARVARTTLDFDREFGGPLLCVDCDGSVETTGGKTPSAHPFTPKVGVSWEPDENSMYYLSAGKGFRVGGVNNPSTATDRPGCPGGLQSPDTYDSDKLWSYEIGAKNQFADGRIRTQAGVFYIDWKDIQQSVSANGCFTSSYKDNLGSAEVSGFDVSAEFLPIDGLSIAVSGGYTRARYSETAFGAPASGTGIRAILAEDGDSLGVSPWNATLSGEYEFVAWGQPSYIRLDYSYTGKDKDDTPQRNPVSSTYDPDLRADPAIIRLDARLGMRVEGFDISLFGRNLLNETPSLGRVHDGLGDPLFFAVTVRPRTLGLTGTYRF